MFGSIGGFEMLVLMVIGLLVFGPRRLPEIGRTLGKAMVEFRRAAMELRSSIEREINLDELQETTRSVSREFNEGVRSVTDAARGAIPEEVRALKDMAQMPDIRPASLLQPAAATPPAAATQPAAATEQPAAATQPAIEGTEPRTDDVAKKD